MTYFIEKLTLKNWFFAVFPRLLHSRVKTQRTPVRCYFFDGTRLARLAANATAWIGGVSVERLKFRLVEVRDEEGLLLRLRISFKDLAEVQADVAKDPIFRDVVLKETGKGRIPMYLAKGLAKTGVTESGTIWRALLLVQICIWKVRNEGIQNERAVLFLELRPWAGAIERYAKRFGVPIVQVNPSLKFNLRAVAQWLLGPKGIQWLRTLRGGPSQWALSFPPNRRAIPENRYSSSVRLAPLDGFSNGRSSSTPRIGVEHYAHWNLSQAELYSDLFFWQQSPLSGNDLVVTFAMRQTPVDDGKWRELAGHGMRALALHPRATTSAQVPLFTPGISHRRKWSERPRLLSPPRAPENAWLKEELRSYRASREYWTELFTAENIKVYVWWYKHDSTHCAIGDAIGSLGGVSVNYQRSFQLDPAVGIAVDTDIAFGFSPAGADVERQSGSVIRYYVATGYLGDHRFQLLRGAAQTVRHTLKKHGAEYILAFFDENSTDDSRWHTGHEFQRENYVFLLEKLLQTKRLGLVLKPKVPRDLRLRLGPVAKLLKQAEATGRCYVYEGGALHGSYPPAVAALASDITIHGHLCAATAGGEAALAGVPTLLLDREGWSVSPLYRLGVGRVVFQDWGDLWAALGEHWAKPGGIPAFGDWSSMLDELDPFRDGRAAERMGTYLKWLMDGFKAGLDRETVMADAAERYCRQWGWDKVTAINDRPGPGLKGRDYLLGGLQANGSREVLLDP